MIAKSEIDFQELAESVAGEVLLDDYHRGMYSTDASIYQITPHAVVLPKTEDDVLAAVAFAREHGISILPRGGGTSLAGQAVGASLIIDFSKYLNQVIELNVGDRWVRVQPGIVRDVLNQYLLPHGLHFAPDPATSSRANIGGMIGNNSSGTKSILYGKTVDHILEARVLTSEGHILVLGEITPDRLGELDAASKKSQILTEFDQIIAANRSEIVARYPKVMRRVGGYNLDEFTDTESWNLAKLITGSEGTLALTLDAKLSLESLPAFKSVCVVHFRELLDAIGAVELMLEYKPSAVEILDETVVKLSRENLTTMRSCHFIEGDPRAILIVEFYGEDPGEVMARPREMIKSLKSKDLGYAHTLFPEGPDYEDVWVIRKKGLGLMLGMKGEKKPIPFIEDAGIPVDVLPEYIDQVLKLCARYHTEVAMYAHASVGVIHVRPILDLRRQEDIQRFKSISEETYQLVKKYKGSWCGEHGDGLVRSAYMRDFFGDQLYGAFQQVKQLFDPLNLMNPGKIVEAPPIDQNLRYGTKYQDEPVTSIFEYREDGTFEAAVHMCSGVGECRKVLGGTMCPSYKATRDEEHTTRGRANALRLAMSGQLKDGLSSKRLHETMDLCLSCKACKSECPSNVDMAKLKSEVLQKFYQANGTKLRDRMVRDSVDYARAMCGSLAPGVNWFQSTFAFRRLQEWMLGIHRERTLPTFAAESLVNWFGKRPVNRTRGPRVSFFADCYSNYHETNIGKSAVGLLEELGFQVDLAAVGCCQRPRISHGFLEKSKEQGTRTALALAKWIDKGIPVVVCEPSCASALSDDLPDLVEDAALASKLERGVSLLENFVLNNSEPSSWSGSNEHHNRYLVHGHCHQKALSGTGDMKNALSQLTGKPVEEINSGCCGMAGSFGYEREHYELSRQIGEQELFPQVRDLPDSVGLIAPGFSCRHQIAHFTGKKALHWVEAVVGA